MKKVQKRAKNNKKSDSKKLPIEKVLLATAILELIKVVIEMITELIE